MIWDLKAESKSSVLNNQYPVAVVWNNILKKKKKKRFYSSKIGEEQSAEDAEDGPPELLVCNFSFLRDKSDSGLCSATFINVLQLFQLIIFF